MFGLGMPEILLILAIALIIIGPAKLPELAKTLGRAMGEFKRSAQDFKRSIDMETTLKDINPLDDEVKNNFKKAREPKPPRDPEKPDESFEETKDSPGTGDFGNDTTNTGNDATDTGDDTKEGGAQ